MIENFGDKRNTNGFDKRPEDAGHPGGPNTSTVVRRFLNLVSQVPNQFTGEKELLHDEIVAVQVNKALNGDTAAFNALLDRLEGKPRQTVEQETTHNIKDIETWGDVFRKKS